MPELDLSTYLADDALTLKGVASKAYPDGHTYVVPSPSAADGLRLKRLMQIRSDNPGLALTGDLLADVQSLISSDDGAEVSIPEKLLGPTFAQMVDDGVSDERINMICHVVLTHYGLGEQVAALLVQAAAGEAAARGNRASRRAAAKSTSAKPRAAKPRAGSKSSPASGATPARTNAPASTRSSKTTAAPRSAPHAKAG